MTKNTVVDCSLQLSGMSCNLPSEKKLNVFVVRKNMPSGTLNTFSACVDDLVEEVIVCHLNQGPAASS